MLVSIFFGFLLLIASAAGQRQCSKITVRKEMNDLTDAEWKIYIDTIVESTRRRDPTSGLSIWETGVKQHSDFVGQNHGTNTFFYFHRYFLTWMEQKLQTINPNFAFFYWDSSREFNTWTRSKIWSKLGTARRGQRIADGPFANIFFNYSNTYLIRDWDYPTAGGNPPSVEYLSQLYQNTLGASNGLTAFTDPAELSHGSFHVLVGGNTGAMAFLGSSPLDPLFYSHHAHFDYYFLQTQIGWASQGKPSSFAIGGRMFDQSPMTPNSRIPGFPSVSIKDVMDVADVCVRYVRSGGGSVDPINWSSSSTAITTTTRASSSITSTIITSTRQTTTTLPVSFTSTRITLTESSTTKPVTTSVSTTTRATSTTKATTVTTQGTTVTTQGTTVTTQGSTVTTQGTTVTTQGTTATTQATTVTTQATTTATGSKATTSSWYLDLLDTTTIVSKASSTSAATTSAPLSSVTTSALVTTTLASSKTYVPVSSSVSSVVTTVSTVSKYVTLTTMSGSVTSTTVLPVTSLTTMTQTVSSYQSVPTASSTTEKSTSSGNTSVMTSSSATSATFTASSVLPTYTLPPPPPNYLPPTYDPRAPFTVSLPKPWIQMVFGDKADRVQSIVNDIQETVKDKINKGETLAPPPMAVDDKTRPYVGVESNLQPVSGNVMNRPLYTLSVVLVTVWMMITTESDLKDLFQQAGTVVRADISTNANGRSRGFGTLTFADEAEAERAIDLFNNYELGGRKLEVREDWALGGKGRLETPTTTPTTARMREEVGTRDLHSSSDPSTITSRSLYVGNIPYSVTWQDVKDLFREYAAVVRVEIPTDYQGRSKGFASVLFETVEDAQKACLAMNGFEWNGRRMDVRQDRSFNENGARTSSPPKAMGARNAGMVPHSIKANGTAPTMPVQAAPIDVAPVSYETDQVPAETEYHEPTGTVLFVGNLSYALQWQELKDLFREAGTVVRADVARDASGRHKGYGQVVMSTPEEAALAIEILNGREVHGREMDVREDKFGTPASFPAAGSQVFVGNVPYTLRWQDLKDIFRNHGFLPLHVEILMEQGTGRSRGCGIVRFGNRETADKAIAALNGTEIGGRNLVLRMDKFA